MANKSSFLKLAGMVTALWLAGFGAMAADNERLREGDTIRLREGYPDTYIVVEGDTLWDIAGEFLEEPWQWPEIWQDNPQIENPNLIYPGDQIALVFVDGRPVLSLARRDDLKTIRLSPRIRREPLRSAIPAIPLESISSMLLGNRIMAESTLESAPYLLGAEGGNLMSSYGDTVFARGSWRDNLTTYEVVRRGREMEDPETGELLGVEGILVGEVSVIDIDGDKGTLRVGKSGQELRAGDRLLPRDTSRIDARYFPEPPDFSVDARIIEIGAGLSFGGINDTLILNVGASDDIEIGHLLTVQKPDNVMHDEIADEDLIFPGKKFASVLIYKVFLDTSFALVLSAESQIRQNDHVVTP